MMLRSKSFIFLMSFFPLVSIQAQDLVFLEPQKFQLTLLTLPDEKSVAQQSKNADFREFKKYVITSAVAVSVVAGILLCYQIRNAAYANDAALSTMHYVPKSTVNNAPAALKSGSENFEQGWVDWVTNKSKNVGLGVGKFFADSGLLMVSGLVMNGAYSYASSKWNQAYTEETVLWFAHEQTQIPSLFNDLKLYATDYDVYASLLSAELLNQDAKVHLKSFIQDLVGSAQTYLGNDAFHDPGYFEFLLNNMKKKYVQKGKELEKLQEYVVPAAAKRHRAMIQEQTTMLFAKDMNRRADIANMCEKLMEEMQKLIAFIQMTSGLRQKARIVDIVESCNKFLAHMEILLNSTPDQLQAFSKNDSGMFTSVYEYEKLFSEQINFLHRYCKLKS